MVLGVEGHPLGHRRGETNRVYVSTVDYQPKVTIFQHWNTGPILLHKGYIKEDQNV